MKISCLKSREDFFEPHFVAIDRRTRMVMDLPGAPKADHRKIATYREEWNDASLTDEEITAYG